MKNKLILFVLLILFKSAAGQKARVTTSLQTFTDMTDRSMAFACKEKERTPGVQFCEIEFLDTNHIQIINHTPSPSFGGCIIKIFINRDLTIDSISYYSWTDIATNAIEIKFEVESPTIAFNSNPFESGLNHFEGRYTFIIKASHFSTKDVVAPTISYRLFQGKFICS